jgi:hypothetical protein
LDARAGEAVFDVKHASVFLLLALLVVAPALRADERLRGFTQRRASWQREYEGRLIALPRPSECGENLRELTREPHLAGTAGGRRVADVVEREFRAAGLEVETPTDL